MFPLALGCMGMSGMYGPTDERESIATIHAALDAGVELIDTGDFYGMGHNELLIGRALRDRPGKARLSVKFGALRAPDGAWLGYDARPAAVKNFLAHTLSRLGVDHIDVYRPARLDPAVPIEDTVGAIAELIQAGYVRAVALSEVGPHTIRRAHAVHPVADLQIEYSLISRGPEARIFPTLDELGIAVTAYGVLSRGLLVGSAPTGAGDFRARMPRFTGDNGARNQALAAALAGLAAEKGATPAQLAIAWVLARRPMAIPVIGARTRAQLTDALGALRVRLTPDDLARLERAVPADAVAGSRYDAHQMRMLDSERGDESARVKGTFDVKLTPQPPFAATDAVTLAQVGVDKQFHGPLEGSSRAEMLAANTKTQGSAGYVAIELVTGTLQGRAGSFVLQHSGAMTRGASSLTLTVVPDSATGDLRGLSGSLKIAIVDGQHFYTFDYKLEPSSPAQ
jgi:aryl-alcohol dehydrogenase-like predicted oxidoreductase